MRLETMARMTRSESSQTLETMVEATVVRTVFGMLGVPDEGPKIARGVR